MTWLGNVLERVAQEALFDTIVSAGLFKYVVNDSKVFWLAEIVIAVTTGKAALVDATPVDVAAGELDGPTMVTRTSIV